MCDSSRRSHRKQESSDYYELTLDAHRYGEKCTAVTVNACTTQTPQVLKIYARSLNLYTGQEKVISELGDIYICSRIQHREC